MLKRRNFITTIVAALGALITGTFSRYAQAKKLGIKLDAVAAIRKPGGSVILKLAGKQIMLIRVSDKDITAISPVCTHQDCFVGYNAARKRLDCKCHGSSFDLGGKVLSGPAPKPLPLYKAQLDNDRVIITVPE